jgi:class 3 adenylate cyclase
LAVTTALSYLIATDLVMERLSRAHRVKLQQLEAEAHDHWDMVLESGSAERVELRMAVERALETYAEGLVRTSAELVFALDRDGRLPLATEDIRVRDSELPALEELFERRPDAMFTVTIGGVRRVASGFYFPPFDWYVVLSERAHAVYRGPNAILIRGAVVALAATVLGTVSVLYLGTRIHGAMRATSNAMLEAAAGADPFPRVHHQPYREPSALSNAFNAMSEALESTIARLKDVAYREAAGRKAEQKVRSVFQHYTPQAVVDAVYGKPEATLLPERRRVVVLVAVFGGLEDALDSDAPGDAVDALNKAFEIVAGAVTQRGGTLDGFRGAVVHAFFGAPVNGGGHATAAVQAALQIADAVGREGERRSRAREPWSPAFIGIACGDATAAVVGTSEVSQYTVLGNTVRMAEALAELSARYRQPILLETGTYRGVSGSIDCRLVDTVRLPGRAASVKLYVPGSRLSETQRQGWELYQAALARYYDRDFVQASSYLTKALHLLPGDPLVRMFLKRCRAYQLHRPGPNWRGTVAVKAP